MFVAAEGQNGAVFQASKYVEEAKKPTNTAII